MWVSASQAPCTVSKPGSLPCSLAKPEVALTTRENFKQLLNTEHDLSNDKPRRRYFYNCLVRGILSVCVCLHWYVCVCVCFCPLCVSMCVSVGTCVCFCVCGISYITVLCRTLIHLLGHCYPLTVKWGRAVNAVFYCQAYQHRNLLSIYVRTGHNEYPEKKTD